MTEKITIDKKIIDNLVVKANVEPTGNTNEWNITNPTWVDGYKEGMLQAVNTLMMPVYLTDHHPEFAVEKYYRVCGTTKLTYEVTPNDVTEKQETKFYVDHEDRFVKMNLSKKAIERDEPATAEQIATFRRAERFASKGRKLDEFHVGDMCKTVDGYMYTIGTDYIAKVSKDESATLIQTAKELQEVENNE